jgi:hypothetical protein
VSEIEVTTSDSDAAIKFTLASCDYVNEKLLAQHFAAHRHAATVAERVRAEPLITRLYNALFELHAVVQGECPSLLNEDSGGDAILSIEIEDLITQLTDEARG